jgi:uncharacterized surface protein with fasciclin (FAS1) repeats
MKAFRLSGYSVLAACAPAGAVVEPVAMPTEKSAVELEPFVETSNTIVDIAAGNPDFSTLFAAVLAADLAEAFSGEGPFTVFAPTNEVFALLPEGTLESLLLPENKQQLIDILLYHVVAGKVMAADVVTLSEAETV